MHTQGKIYSRKVISEVLGISEKWVKELTDKGVLVEFSKGHYKLVPVIHAFIKHLQAQNADSDTASDYNVEKARLTRAKREDAELEIQLKRNELHRADNVEFFITNMLVAFKAKLDTLPHKVLPSILALPDDKDRAERLVVILRKATTDALEELAEYEPTNFAEGGNIGKTEESETP